MRLFLLTLVSLALASCVNTQTAERKAVPPPGTGAEGSLPWNIPQKGEGAGGMGGLLEGR
ncbi:MAG: hypothetical protein ACJA16_005063 [Akkermansiaceae bacterium]|jgi:hypothetical protein